MGQYHLIVNLDKRQYIEPHALGNGAKLMEFGRSADGALTALTLLLACSNGRGLGDFYLPKSTLQGEEKAALAERYSEIVGSWAGDRIAIVGDYAKDIDLPTGASPFPASHIYELCVAGGDLRERWASWTVQLADMAGDRDSWRLTIEPHDLFTDVSSYLAVLLEAGEGIKITAW